MSGTVSAPPVLLETVPEKLPVKERFETERTEAWGFEYRVVVVVERLEVVAALGAVVEELRYRPLAPRTRAAWNRMLDSDREYLNTPQ